MDCAAITTHSVHRSYNLPRMYFLVAVSLMDLKMG